MDTYTTILASVVVTLVLLIPTAFLVNARMSDMEDHQSTIVRSYEDGSARIEFSNGTCVIPAFDSSGDFIQCRRTND